MAVVPPTGDIPLLNWTENADARLTAAPVIFGITAAIALELHGLYLDCKART